ncbi:unnamed protein product [Ectocarpus sp. 13 AM-2016]
MDLIARTPHPFVGFSSLLFYAASVGSRASPSHMYILLYMYLPPSPLICLTSAGGPTGFSWFKLVFGIVYMTFGVYCLVLFFRARDVFEIRARSVYLVTTLGLLLLLYEGITVDLHAIVLFGTPAHYFTNNLLVFFVTFSIASCYISRVIRLAVGFHPKLRRSMPKLMSEKLLIAVSLSIGVMSLSIPIYYKFTLPNEDYREHQAGVKWLCTLVLQIAQICLLPVVWYIDDLFHISRELMVIIVLGLIQSVFVKLYIEEDLTGEIRNFINPPNMQLLTISVLFGLSVIDPVRRLKFSPMAQSSAPMARAVLRSSAANTQRPRRGSSSSQQRKVTPSEEAAQHMWTYDKIAVDNSMAEAFRVFANRALCQESVWFLEEVSRYQNEDYTIASPLGGGKIEAFEAIAKRFVEDGAPDEVNLSYTDKKNIIAMLNKEARGFEPSDEELSGVFDRAYSQIRYMIESNIVHKFLETDEFRKAANSLPPSRRERRLFLLPC